VIVLPFGAVGATIDNVRRDTRRRLETLSELGGGDERDDARHSQYCQGAHYAR
jgi:hypothetical protein